MKKITITIDTVNAAFEVDPGHEVANILRELARRFEAGATPQGMLDRNGNRVGTCKVR